MTTDPIMPGLRTRLASRHGYDTLCLPVGELRGLVAEIDRLRAGQTAVLAACDAEEQVIRRRGHNLPENEHWVKDAAIPTAEIRALLGAAVSTDDDEGVERGQVSRLWAEDWDSAEDAAYDLPRREDDVAAWLKRERDRIYAPFTDAEQAALNAFQRDGRMHPFTCPDHSDQPLLAERHWRCLECDYTQYWAHAFMAETPTPIEETDHG